jgi:sugar phosphate isomerase/epimerase
MKILFCTLTLRPYLSQAAAQRGYPLPDERKWLWDWLVEHGFDGIDLGETWFDFYHAPDEALAALGEEIRQHGLEIGGLSVLRKIIKPPKTPTVGKRRGPCRGTDRQHVHLAATVAGGDPGTGFAGPGQTRW